MSNINPNLVSLKPNTVSFAFVPSASAAPLCPCFRPVLVKWALRPYCNRYSVPSWQNKQQVACATIKAQHRSIPDPQAMFLRSETLPLHVIRSLSTPASPES